MQLGSTYTLKTYGGLYVVGYNIYIDFNNDGTFQTSEYMGTGSTSTGGGIVSTSFTIPSTGITYTGPVRMRIEGNYSSAPSSSSPCTAETYGESREYIVNIAAPPPAGTVSPTSLAFANTLTGSTTASQTFNVTGSYMTSSPVTITAPTGFQVSPDNSTWYSTSYTQSFTIPNLSATVYVRFAPSSAISYSGNVTVTGGGLTTTLNVACTGNGVVACSGTPSGGTAVANPGGGGSSTPVTLSLTGITVGGVTYQWQSSSTGSGYTNISGATNATYSFTGLTANTYYQCVVTCTGSGLSGTSTPVEVMYVGCIPSGLSYTNTSLLTSWS